ncbi:MAG: ATP-grasp domain-containing protein [Magnetococcales bacterium]|nr:ATP-grasp domain-containing protein [Magnetococcales bacterium]
MCDLRLGGEGAPAIAIGASGIRWGGVDFSEIRAMYIRGLAPNTPQTLPALRNACDDAHWRLEFIREQGYQATVFGFFDYLSAMGKLVVNPPTLGYPDHDAKGQFYERLRAHGFCVPVSLVTNDPESAREFLDRFPDAVVKPAIGVGSTRVITARDRERLNEVRVTPVLLQERIAGSTVRVHVVGGRVVLALRILSEGGVDSRTGKKSFEFLALSAEEEERISRATRCMGLHFAAWDVIEAPDGRMVLLDCNPGPYVMWIGEAFVQVVFRQLAIFLVTFARSGSLTEACAQVVPWHPS